MKTARWRQKWVRVDRSLFLSFQEKYAGINFTAIKKREMDRTVVSDVAPVFRTPRKGDILRLEVSVWQYVARDLINSLS